MREFEIVNESYTSICSFYDNEEICKHEEYLGKRTERGLFITKDGNKGKCRYKWSVKYTKEK